jgi:ATP-dependent Clp protease ATP-binding subunit ClpA
MFERFTDRARKVMALANQEAKRFNHEYIGTEHILLGLVKEGSGVGANVLKNMDVDLRKVRLEVEKLIKSGPEMVTFGKLPQTPRAKQVIEYAIEESRGLDHNYVGSEHLLLGLLCEHDGVAAQVLMNQGLNLEDVRREVLNLLGAGIEEEDQALAQAAQPPSMFKGFTDRARKVMALANQEAQRFNHEYISTEHILLGLVKEGSGVGANVLKNMDVDLRKVRREVEKLVKRGDGLVTMGKLPQTPRAKQVIEYAIEEARQLNHNYVATEHLLLGLLREYDGVGAQVLMNLGLQLEDVRSEVLNLLGAGSSRSSLDESGAETRRRTRRSPKPIENLEAAAAEEEQAEPKSVEFTDRASMVMALARQEAQRLNQQYVGTEHILLGMVKEGAGIGAKVLKIMSVDLQKVRQEVEKLVKDGTGAATTSELSKSPRAKKAIEYARDEARRLGQDYVDTQHLLLGLLHEHDGVAAQVLKNLGLNLEDVRWEVLSLFVAASMDKPAGADAERKWATFRRFTDRARKVMALASREARRLNHDYLGTEHVLLGLVEEGSGVGANILKNMGLDLRKVRHEVEKLVKSGPDMITMGKLPQTPSVKKVIQFSIQESHSLGHSEVGTEHLLLGLIRDRNSTAASVLTNLGITSDDVRKEIYALVGDEEASVNAGVAEKPMENAFIDIGTRREIFVDDYLIDSLDGTSLKLQTPQPAGAAVTYNDPWEDSSFYTTVLKDGDLFRMYYRGRLPDWSCCYAESDDGVNWIKPNLGMVEYDGSTDNNIFLAKATTFFPFIDARPGVPAEERFKANAAERGSPQGGLMGYVSADGIHWRKLGDEPIVPIIWPLESGGWAGRENSYDSHNIMFWSEVEECYVLFARHMTGGRRSTMRSATSDFRKWPEPTLMTYSDTGSTTPSAHLYTNGTQPYFRAPHIYISLPGRIFFTDAEHVVREDDIADAEARVVSLELLEFCGENMSLGPWHGRVPAGDYSDGVLLTTRAGSTHYDFRFQESFIRPGIGLANWTTRNNYPACGIIQTSPTEMTVFVQRHYTQKTAYLERLTLRLDGFASVNAPHASGMMLTKPFVFTGKQLEINYSTSAAGSIRVGLQHPDGAEVEGRALADCPAMTGDSIDQVVRWGGDSDVSAMSGKPVRLNFAMKDADLFSLRFRE